jgi:hypothetical protein
LSAGQPLGFAWRLDATAQDPAALDTAPEPVDEDTYGLEVLEAAWQGPAIGRVKPTVDLNGLCVGKYVVLLAPEEDAYTFMVKEQPMWLGRVSKTLSPVHPTDANIT